MEIATSYNTFKLARWIERTIPLLDICHNHHNSWLCKKLAKCRIFKSEREKLFYTQCKIVHTVQNFTHSFIVNSRT